MTSDPDPFEQGQQDAVGAENAGAEIADRQPGLDRAAGAHELGLRLDGDLHLLGGELAEIAVADAPSATRRRGFTISTWAFR